VRLLIAAIALTISSLFVADPAEAASSLQISRILYNPAGSDTGTNSHLNQEYIRIRNLSSTTKSIAGWRVRDAAGHSYTFPTGARILPGEEATLRTGKGTNSSKTFYWGRTWYIWNNNGDKAYLIRSDGTTADTCSYGGGATYKGCL
jgi:Lamin Tail Domain